MVSLYIPFHHALINAKSFVQYILDGVIVFSTGLIALDKCAIYLLKEGLQKLFSVYMAEVAEVSVLMSGQRTVGMYCLHSFALFFSSRPSA